MGNLRNWYIRRLTRVVRPYLKSYGLLQTAKMFNKSTIIWEPKDERVLVLAPHFDDEVIGCGGTLFKHILRGAQVTVVFMTDGRNGSKTLSELNGKVRTNEENNIVQKRKKEADLALNSLNIKDKIFLDAECSNLISNKEIQNKLREILYKVKPDIVYLPFFLEQHPDHKATSQILIDATENLDFSFDCLGYEVWTPLFPNILVNIDETIEAKKRALEYYTSQLAEKNFIHTNLGLNAYRSIPFYDSNVKYAEAFFFASLNDYRKIYKSYNEFGMNN